jgi:hypothetical protein
MQPGLPTVRIIAARKIEWPRQRRLVPAHAPARALHYAQRHRIRARREGVIGEFALTRQNFGPGIEERARLDRNPHPRTIDGAIGLSGVRLSFDRRYVSHRCSEHCKPDWTPPGEMLQRRPDLPRHMAGGPDNPMGARAIYLGASLYRIHGSNEPDKIGQAVSSGCIRLTNQDVIDLYNRVQIGATVIVQ